MIGDLTLLWESQFLLNVTHNHKLTNSTHTPKNKSQNQKFNTNNNPNPEAHTVYNQLPINANPRTQLRKLKTQITIPQSHKCN
jgi:hypothetical protein